MHIDRDVESLLQHIADLDLPRVPQQARSRQKRDALLAAAGRLFEEHGYESTTADDIAAAAGVSIGTFYSYFRNKRQIFLAIYHECLEAILALGIADLDFGDNPRQAIRAALQRARERERQYDGWRRAWRELVPRDPEIAAYDQQLNNLIYQQVLGAVRRAAALGLTWPDLDIEMTCRLIAVVLDQAKPGKDEATPEQLQRQSDALADMLYRAVFKG